MNHLRAYCFLLLSLLIITYPHYALSFEYDFLNSGINKNQVLNYLKENNIEIPINIDLAKEYKNPTNNILMYRDTLFDKKASVMLTFTCNTEKLYKAEIRIYSNKKEVKELRSLLDMKIRNKYESNTSLEYFSGRGPEKNIGGGLFCPSTDFIRYRTNNDEVLIELLSCRPIIDITYTDVNIKKENMKEERERWGLKHGDSSKF
ncbi:hypothetical protein [Desulfopila aestuarii]|uniref:Uncharacterized protein n=1 Tax=Desulfopila aestuarii DSM 18488 TaxID=1121416 RepID=A0A1M7YMA9_9BACT|nr:hypothetical protein [Desulfopila aestuarii]SHO53764.1 hypothetical protein SAMN02745220_05293 [Desulfopila aestuarii DSM 18488]